MPRTEGAVDLGPTQPTYADRPGFEAPRAKNRAYQDWMRCAMCEMWFAAIVRDIETGKRKFCSWGCTAEHAIATERFANDKNPRWLGGVSEDNMRYRERQAERWPEKEAARKALSYQVRMGYITRQPCGTCGVANANGYHKDFKKPLDVIWLCRPCYDVSAHTELPPRGWDVAPTRRKRVLAKK